MTGFLAIYRKGDAPTGLNPTGTIQKTIESDRLTAYLFDAKRKVRTATKNNVTIGIEGSVFLSDDALIESFERGLDPFFDGIRGWFNLFAIDEKRKRYIFAHDHLGIKPLYWLENDRYIAVSSTLEALPEKGDIDQAALVEYLIFNHPLGENTFLKDVKLLEPGHYLKIEDGKLTKHRYFDPDSLFTDNPITGKKALSMINDSFVEAVTRITPDQGKTGLSLTGGFDGRTVLAAVKDMRKLLLYTFGTPQSSDMVVATEVARRMGLPHRQFLIDQSYHETMFPQLAQEMILNSDGLATFERAHYLMAFRNIGKEVDVVLSGNCGSELFRAIHITDCIVSPLMGNLLRSDDYRPEYERFIDTMTDNIPLLDPASDLKDQLLESFDRQIWQPLKGYNLSKRFYLLQLLESFRKYFGTEMRIASHYAENHSAFLDFDFIRTLNKTKFTAAYQTVFTENPILRKTGQVTYAHIIKKNSPMLADIKTGRGYTPAAILSPIGLLSIVAPYVKKYFRKPENTFDWENNALRFYELNLPKCQSPYFDFEKTKYAIESGEWKQQRRLYARITSWGYWYNHNR